MTSPQMQEQYRQQLLADSYRQLHLLVRRLLPHVIQPQSLSPSQIRAAYERGKADVP